MDRLAADPRLKLYISALAVSAMVAGLATRYAWSQYALFAAFGVGVYVMGGLYLYRPRRWLLGDAVFAGASFGIAAATLEFLYRLATA